VENAESPVFVFESGGRSALAGFHPSSYHTDFFGISVVSIDPLIFYNLESREKVTCLREIGFLLETRVKPSIVWSRCDESEGDLVRCFAEFGGEYCGTSVRMSQWMNAVKCPEVVDGISVREAEDADRKTLGAVAENSHRHSHFFRDPFLPKERTAELFPSYLEGCIGKDPYTCLVAEDEEGRAIGFSLLLCPNPDGQKRRIGRSVGIIDFIAVEPGTQRKGIGKILLARSFEEFHERGYELVELKTMLDNRQAIGFYQRYGFRVLTTEMLFSFRSGWGGVGK
jgi:ribosomal protein S18 acetylase RimI-like enzyme